MSARRYQLEDGNVYVLSEDYAALSAQNAELAYEAARYRWLLARAGQIGPRLWPHAPWIHESSEENQARLELCIDESRVDDIAKAQP